MNSAHGRSIVNTRWTRLVALVAAGVGLVALTGCATAFSGGGLIQSADGMDKASFGLDFRCQAPPDALSCNQGTAHGAYHDQAVGVALRFDGVIDAVGPALGSNQCMLGVLDYTSLSNAHPGTGMVLVAACDDGKMGQGQDAILLQVRSGPYTLAGGFGRDYSNSGTVLAGNLVAH
jgi:hypothetical protein